MAYTRLFLASIMFGPWVLLPTVALAHHDEHQRDLGFPNCVSDCIEGSGCGTADVKCMCRASRGDFLSDVVACMDQDCSQSISVDTLLGTLELACNILGSPIPDSAVSSAEAAQSSLDNPGQTTVTASETTTAQATSSSQTTYAATSKATTTIATLTSTSTTETNSEADSTSVQNTSGASVTTTTTSVASSTTDVQLSTDTTQTSSDSSTTTTTAGSGDPTGESDLLRT